LGQDLVSSALTSHVLAVTAGSRASLDKAGSVFAGKALETLEARLVEMDYTPAAWEAGVPALKLPAKGSGSKGRKANPFDLFKLLEHKASTQTSSAKTLSLYEGSVKRFEKFVGHTDASRITKSNVREWRDAMITEGLSSATINRKHLAALGAILEHGVKEFDLEKNEAHGIKDKREDVGAVVKKEYDRAVVEDILKATFAGSAKVGLSAPHRRAIFWLPWLMTYTGLRAGEVAQLQGRSVLEHRGQPYLLITPDDGSTKSRRAWTTGLHDHLIELGFVEFVRGVGDGPLFYTPYPKTTSLQVIKNPRWEQSYKRVGEWITGELGIDAPLGRANHAFRHAMTTASRGGQDEEDAWERLDKEARDYMLGSRPQNDAREGYGEWPPSVLNREINKLPRFAVKDLGTRPYE
jgi:integrase